MLVDGEEVVFVESVKVTDGVRCDVYRYTGTLEKDLGIITVKKGFKTPLQRVVGGDKTIEKHMSGKAILRIVDVHDNQKEYVFPSDRAEV